MVKPTFSGECEYPSLGRFVTLLGSCWCAPPVWDPRESELVPELTVSSDAARRQGVQGPGAKGPRAPSAPLMGPWGGRARGPRAPSAPYGQGTKGPMGPLGVIPRSFRVDRYFEWVVILSVTVRGNCFIAQQNRLSMRCCDGRTSSRSKRKFLQSGETWGHLILAPENTRRL